MLKTKFVQILIGISVILLFGNIIVGITDSEEKVPVKKELYVHEIDSLFFRSLRHFDIKNEWLQKKHIKNKIDSVSYIFYLNLPKSITIASVIKEINSAYFNLPVKVTSTERKNFGKTVLEIHSNNNQKLQCYLDYDKKLKREYSKISFLISDIENLDEFELEKLLKISYDYNLLSLHEENYQSLQKSINENKKESILLIDDNIDSKKYSLQPGNEKVRLKNSILKLKSDFNKINFYVIDQKSKLFNSTAYSYIRNELIRQKIKILAKSDFININRESSKEIISLLDFYSESSKSKEVVKLVITAENFLSIENHLPKLFDKGTLFVNISSIN